MSFLKPLKTTGKETSTTTTLAITRPSHRKQKTATMHEMTGTADRPDPQLEIEGQLRPKEETTPGTPMIRTPKTDGQTDRGPWFYKFLFSWSQLGVTKISIIFLDYTNSTYDVQRRPRSTFFSRTN